MNDTSAKKDVTKLQRAIVDALEDVKAQDIQVFDTENLSALFERVVVASGTSNRQTKALAASVRDKVRLAGFPKPRIEGEDNGEWIIEDCGVAVVHVMQPTIRSYYNLEELWGDKPVRLKLGATKPAQASKKPALTKVTKVQHAGKAPRRAEVEPVKAQMPGRSRKTAKTEGELSGDVATTKKIGSTSTTKIAGKTAAKTAPKSATKSTSKTAVKSAPKPVAKLVKVNEPSKPAKKAAAKSLSKPSLKRAPAKRSAPRSA